MKFIKGLLITLLALFAIWVILALFSSKGYDVTREIKTEASPEQIWNQISEFEKWQSWSPWKAKDPSMESEYQGTPGTIGSKTSWVGDPELSGTGNMTINEVVPNNKLGYDLQFGDISSSKGFIEINKVEDSSKITWNDKGDLPFLMRPMALFGMFEKMMGPDFEAGLAKIKELAESDNSSTPKEIVISQVDMTETKYLGVRHKTTISELMKAEFFGTNFGNIMGAMDKENIQMAGYPSCIYYDWNEVDSTAEALPCIPFASSITKIPEGMEVVTAPTCKALKAAYYGPYNGAAVAHMKLDEYCKANAIKTGLVIEEYANDPTEVAESDILTNIYYLILD